MALFTIVADYQGGTYLTQISAQNENDAAARWPDSREIQEVAVSLELPLGAFREALGTPFATPVGDLQNCWCVTADISDRLLLLHIIKTEETA